MSKYGVFPGPYFPVFELNTKTYGVNRRLQSKYRKLRTRKSYVFGHLSHSDYDALLFKDRIKTFLYNKENNGVSNHLVELHMVML